MAEKQTLTAAQRAANFAVATRQNMQMFAKQTAHNGATTLSFTLPKARLLSKIILSFECKFTAKHATASTLPAIDKLDIFKIVRRLSLDMNNGFQPFVVSGVQLAMLNMVSQYKGNYVIDAPNDSDDNAYGCWLNKGASTTGKENTVRFTLELPVTLNDRDAISLILLQNESTVVDVKCDIGNISDVFKDATGYTLDITEVSMTPLIESFSIPANSDAFPDVSVLKLTDGRNESCSGSGQHIVKLDTGTIYRRLVLRFTDDNGEPLSEDDITSTIDLVFNQADSNYQITPHLLRMLNTRQYGFTLPKGVYVFDFAYQGIVNMSGTRDYIDTERLTEFWVRFTSSKSCRVEMVAEKISRLK